MVSNKIMAINWKSLAKDLGCFRQGGDERYESGSSDFAKQAIATLLGEENLLAAVDYYISGEPGSELARSVLWQLRPWCAMKYCYDIYKFSENIENRISAIELLRVIADRRVLIWIEEFLSDANEGIQFWGIGIVDQLLFSQLVEYEDVQNILEKARDHKNSQVVEKAYEIIESWEEK
jgi:hypothetical protein